MIERFNFYDVYGYLLPGLALLGLAWLPFAVIKHKWPENELLSAVAVLAIGYVVGHVLQSVATIAVPSTFADSKGRRRFPSDLLLDKSNAQFSVGAKKRIREKAMQQFSIDVSAGDDGDKELSHARRDVFLLARQTLIRDKSAGYAEQFEGLYALMRGLAVASTLGACYLFSWALSIWKPPCAQLIALWSLGASILIVVITGSARLLLALQDPKKHPIDRVTLLALAMGCASAGYLLGFSRLTELNDCRLYGLLGVILLVLAQRFCLGYKAFAFEFASAVWRYYAHQSGAESANVD